MQTGNGGLDTLKRRSRKRHTSGLRRAGFATGPAAAITLALFAGMDALIAVDEVTLEKTPYRPLEEIVWDHAEPETVICVLQLPERPAEPPELPPAKQQTKMSTADVGFQPVTFDNAPKIVPRGRLITMELTASPIGNRVAQAVRPPVPPYPDAMARAGVEGNCEVRFDITARGLPYNVMADCTHRGFERVATRAVERAEFLPGMADGSPVGATGLTWPLEFRLTD